MIKFLLILVAITTIMMKKEKIETILIHQIGYTSRLMSNCINRIASVRGLDVSYGQMPIMMMLRARETCPQNDIVKAVMKEKATVTRLINSMEKKGLVSKRKNPDDKRNNLISLTQKGKALMDDLQPLLENFNKQVRTGLPEEDIQYFDRIIRKVQQNIFSCHRLFEKNIDE